MELNGGIIQQDYFPSTVGDTQILIVHVDVLVRGMVLYVVLPACLLVAPNRIAFLVEKQSYITHIYVYSMYVYVYIYIHMHMCIYVCVRTTSIYI